MQDPKEIKLYRDDTELADSTTLAESKAENADTIAMALALPGGAPLQQSFLFRCNSKVRKGDETFFIGHGVQFRGPIRVWLAKFPCLCFLQSLGSLRRWKSHPMTQSSAHRCGAMENAEPQLAADRMSAGTPAASAEYEAA